jgi:hypothetical protein
VIPLSKYFGAIYSSWGRVIGAVYSSWFLCVSCGFMETWIERKEDLEKVARKVKPLTERI